MQDGVLVWSNAAFTNLDAAFCQDSTGQVWVVFDAKPPPFQCTPVMLIPFAGKPCPPLFLVLFFLFFFLFFPLRRN